MATIEEYEAVAPTVMSTGEFTVTQIENKLSSIPSAPEPQPTPTITKAKVVNIFNTVFDTWSVSTGIANAGGILEIARDNDLTTSQVKLIIKEISAMYNAYLTPEE